MAKRATKNPAPQDDAQPAALQIPEVSSAPPSPWGQSAASVPQIPGAGSVTAGLPGKPKSKPSLSAGQDDYDPDAFQRSRANQSEPILTLYRPARGRTTVLGTELLGDCAVKNELGNREPSKALITKSKDRKWFFIMPVHHTTNKAVEITYQSKLAAINLFGSFQDMGRTVTKGYKEHYYLQMTDEPMTIHGVTGYALYFSLVEYGEEAISAREESEMEAATPKKAGRAAKADAKRTANAGVTPGNENVAQTEAKAGSPSPDLDEPTDEEEDQRLLVDGLHYMVEERDAKIDEIQAKLKAYEERFGKL